MLTTLLFGEVITNVKHSIIHIIDYMSLQASTVATTPRMSDVKKYNTSMMRMLTRALTF